MAAQEDLKRLISEFAYEILTYTIWYNFCVKAHYDTLKKESLSSQELMSISIASVCKI